MKVNIKDVAKEAGVSMSTVSRVINDNYPVKEETKKRVKEVIDKLNFSPNVLARSLIVQNTKTIGVIVPSINNVFFSTVTKGIEHSLSSKEYSIYLCDTDDNALEEIRYIKSLMSRQVDGIIVVDPKTENMKNGFYESLSSDIPLVCINGYNKKINCNFIINDEASGAYEAVKYLIDLGHKDILFIRGNESYSYDIKEQVYKEILTEKGLSKNMRCINIGGGNSDETVERTMQVLCSELKKGKVPTAIFACNDLMALGAVNACKKLNYDVPKDISIIGFDNTYISTIVEPKLTTVDQNMYELGENASKMLINIIENNSKEIKKIKFKTKLIIRDSCSRI